MLIAVLALLASTYFWWNPRPAPAPPPGGSTATSTPSRTTTKTSAPVTRRRSPSPSPARTEAVVNPAPEETTDDAGLPCFLIPTACEGSGPANGGNNGEDAGPDATAPTLPGGLPIFPGDGGGNNGG